MEAATRPAAARRGWLRVVRAVYLLALVAVLAWVVSRREDAVVELFVGTRLWVVLVALVLSFLQLVVSAQFWAAAIGALGQTVRWRVVLSATAESVPARYLPGSVWYAVGRAAVLRRHGVSGRALGVVAVLESALTVVVSIAFGGALLLVAGRFPASTVLGVAWVFGLVALASPPVLNRLLAFAARRRGGTVGTLSWGQYARLIPWMALFWVSSATTFTVYLHAFPLDLPSPLVVAGTLMVAWGVGFLAPFAPQGAGVFEVLFAGLLAGGSGGALVVAVASYRGLMLIRDMLAFVGGAVARSRKA